MVYDNDLVFGYYPNEIFTHLEGGATFLQFGGFTHGSPDGLSPPMGKGQLPDPDFKKNSFFYQLKVQNINGDFVDVSINKFTKVVDNKTCYDARSWGNQMGKLLQTFSYGGPGGRCGL